MNTNSNQTINAILETGVDLEKGRLKDEQESNTQREDEKNAACYIIGGTTICISIIFVPFMVCDLYFGYTDDSCINQKAGKLIITVADYLKVCGYIWLCGYIIAIVSLTLTGLEIVPAECTKILNNFLTPLNTFNVIWTIFGAVMFWGLIDNTICNEAVYNYMFAQLIFRLVGQTLSACGQVQKKE